MAPQRCSGGMKFRAPLFFAALLSGCAHPSTPSPQAAPNGPARQLAPLGGDLASADVPTFEAACAERLQSAKKRIAQLKATPRPVPRVEVGRVLEVYDE